MTRTAARVAEHTFRHESGRIVAALTRTLGPAGLELAESAVQEAFVAALRVWPMRGIPERPEAWLYRAARNRALDELRRSTRAGDAEGRLLRELESAVEPGGAHFSGEIVDDELRLMFLCCHPRLPRASRVALMLQVAAGFSAREIARAFRVPEPTIAQRIVRAKRALRDADVPLALPRREDVGGRLEAVLDALYLVFNEGYTLRDGDAAARIELAEEAIRLTRLVLGHPAGREPHVHALLSLLLLQSSRTAARIGADGAAVPLGEQDRSRWDRARIDEGLDALAAAGRGPAVTEYHLLAGIAACHAAAAHPASTDWRRILDCYDELVASGGGDLVLLNRAVALGRANGADEGLAALDELTRSAALAGEAALPAARADALDRLGRSEEACAEWARAADLAGSEPERRYFAKRAGRLR
ncbi:MAG: RNA polymerase sigma factor [Candidatus Eiseniibacteriota bacterium]